MQSQTPPRVAKQPSLAIALVPVALTLAILGLQLFYFGDFTPHIPLAFGIAITALVGVALGRTWRDLEGGIFHVINVSLPSVSILVIVGMLIGTWIAAGTVPSLIYYGLILLSPEIFLAAAMILCAVVSVSLGTSWGTVGTVGLALMGIGAGFGIPPYWTAGAVVSGAFFGDKVSPLSDTTNLAPAVTGAKLFDHIRNLMPTTVPAMLVALVIYTAVGFTLIDSGQASFARIEAITSALQAGFHISPLALAPAVLVIALAVTKNPPIPSLFAGAVAGGLLAVFGQGQSVHDTFTFANAGYTMDTGVDEVDALLSRGGIQSMMWTISLVLLALGFGGALERTGCLQAIIGALIRRVKRFAGIQASATGAAISTNLVAGDPYLSIALPGRMFAPVYRGMGYSTLNLSRAVEEGGTLVSPLIPWNAGGAFVIAALALGIRDGATVNLLYIPLAFACWLSPVIGVTYAALGWFSPKASTDERAEWARQGEEVRTMQASADAAS